MEHHPEVPCVSLASKVVDEEHGEVVTLRSAANERCNLFLHILQVLICAFPAGQDLFHSLFPELHMVRVLSFCKTIGIKEEGVVVTETDSLLLELHSGHYSEREVGFHRKELHGTGKDKRRIMACIAVAQKAARQIQHAAEVGHEHTAFVHGAQTLIHGTNNLSRTVFTRRQVAERGAGNRHHKRCRNALAAHVANTEKEFLVANIVIVEVAAHFPCRHDVGRHVKVVSLRERREHLGNHRHLDATGDVQIAFHALALLVELLILLVMPEY